MTKSPGVHLIPVGFEYDRVIKPIIERYPAKKAYLLLGKTNSGGFPLEEKLSRNFAKKIEQLPVDFEHRELDIYDFDAVFDEVYRIMREEAENNEPIYVHISPAPRVMFAAMMFASFLIENDAKIEMIYVKPKEYLYPQIIQAMSHLNRKDSVNKAVEELKELYEQFNKFGNGVDVNEIIGLPPFPVQELSPLEFETLKVLLDEREVDSIQDLVLLINEQRDEPVARSNIQYYLRELERKKLINTERDKKKLRIQIEPVGELYGKTMVL
jgi:hypothetical protein